MINFFISGQKKRIRKETLENQQNTDAQRERYYATIHKVALQAGDKIPGESRCIPFEFVFLNSFASQKHQKTFHHMQHSNCLRRQH